MGQCAAPAVAPNLTALCSFSYYGILLILPEVLAQPDAADGDDLNTDDLDYPGLFIASLAEVVGCTIAFLLVDRVGRKGLSGVAYVLCAAFVGVLAATRDAPAAAQVAISSLARCATFVASSTMWVMTPEQYPTQVRAAGHSFANACGRVGAFISPFWVSAGGIPESLRLAALAIASAAAGLATLALPETRGVFLG